MIACSATNNESGNFAILPLALDGNFARSDDEVATFATANDFVAWKLEIEPPQRVWFVSTRNKSYSEAGGVIYDMIVWFLLRRISEIDPTIQQQSSDLKIRYESPDKLLVLCGDGQEFKAVIVDSVGVRVKRA